MAALGTRIKVRYRSEPLYVAIFPKKCEIFISRIDKPEQTNNDLTMSGIDLVARLSSKCWQAYGLEELLKQLNRASRCKSDMPHILYVLLEDYA